MLKTARVLSAALCLLFAIAGCNTEKKGADVAAGAPLPSYTCRASTEPPGSAPELNCPAPPSTWDVSPYFGASPTPQTPPPSMTAMKQAGPAFDSWAWATFAALNWPAKAEPSWPTGYVRGVPDLTKTFLDASPTDVLVWETFKEKREVFNTTGQTVWKELTFPPDQTPAGLQGGLVPACSAESAELLENLSGGAHRRVLQASKLAPQLARGAHALDETAEVGSPAQEAQSALCAGTHPDQMAECMAMFLPPPGGNADTEYLPKAVNRRPGVGPRVFDPDGNIVFYEVRVNYDYFDYVVQNKLNELNPPGKQPPPPPLEPGTIAKYEKYSLPWRTSAKAPPLTGNKPPKRTVADQRVSVLQYDPNAAIKAYAAENNKPQTPPRVGSIQVKSAWRMLDQNQNEGTYHMTDAVYFKSAEVTEQNTTGRCYDVARFGLIGLHIIQRVHMGNAGQANAHPVGGTFIYATFEHNSLAQPSNYKYVNFLTAGGQEQVQPESYPDKSSAITVEREQAYPLASTNAVNQSVMKALNANSVWSNYRLIGTQFYANVGDPKGSLQYNQPYYLANIVIETNRGLQNFQGLPPNAPSAFTPARNKNYAKAFDPGANNVTFNGKPYNMGGCMGCHGVAQNFGTNFSFVLLDGLKGAGIDTPTDVTIPPSPPPPTETAKANTP